MAPKMKLVTWRNKKKDKSLTYITARFETRCRKKLDMDSHFPSSLPACICLWLLVFACICQRALADRMTLEGNKCVHVPHFAIDPISLLFGASNAASQLEHHCIHKTLLIPRLLSLSMSYELFAFPQRFPQSRGVEGAGVFYETILTPIIALPINISPLHKRTQYCSTPAEKMCYSEIKAKRNAQKIAARQPRIKY